MYYESSSIVPTDSLQRETRRAIGDGQTFRIGADVALLELNEEAKDSARKLASLAEKCENASLLMEALAGFLPTISQLSTDESQVEILGPTIKSEFFETTAKNAETDKYIGLHVDNWDGKDLSNRADRRNRISVNCGVEDRYLLFFPFLISDVVQQNERIMSRSEIREAVRNAVQRHRSTPIVRLRVPSMHLYIAPTENLVHDGQCHSHVAPDITFVSLGKFSPEKFLSQIECFELVR